MHHTLEAAVAQELLAKLSIGVMVTDAGGQVIWHNEAMQTLLSTDVPPGQSGQLMSEAILPFLHAQGTFPLVDRGSEDQKWLKHVSLELANGSHAHIYQDVTEAKFFQQERDRLVEQLHAQAATDSLTGLLTEHALLQGLTPLVSLSRRYEKPLSVVLIAVDNVDQISVGDQPLSADLVLVAIAQLLKDQMRWADLIARLSDNRFLLVLPETGKDAASMLVDKLAPKLQSLAAPELSSEPLSLAARFAVTEWTRTDDARRLISRCRASLAAPSQPGHAVA